jgi:hypothetical protein
LRLGVAGGGEAVSVGEADRVRASKARSRDADRLGWLVDGDAKGGDRLARSS